MSSSSISIRPTNVTLAPLLPAAAVVLSAPRVRSERTFELLLPYSIFSLPTKIVPLAGNEEESAKGIEVLTSVMFADSVEAAVSTVVSAPETSAPTCTGDHDP